MRQFTYIAAMRLEPILKANLIKLARAYAVHEGIKMSTVARYIHGTSDIFEKLELGSASLSQRTYDDMVEKLEARWPEGLKRPKLREPFAEAKPKGQMHEAR
mgnify:CR=1 FL=1